MTAELDKEELLHLALYSMRNDAPEDAIRQLKAVLAQDAGDARANFLLGGCYADIGLYDRAVDAMQQAVDADPSLDTARFQLGLLHLTSGRVAEAESAWAPLESLGPESALNRFQSALRHVAHDDAPAAIAEFEAGLGLGPITPELEKDMRRVLENVRQASGTAEATGGAIPDAGMSDSAPLEAHVRPVFLAAYHGLGRGGPPTG